MQDLIAGITNEVSSGVNDKKIVYHLHRNDTEYKNGWILQKEVE